MKKIILGLVASLAFTASLAAADFGPLPADYQSAAQGYISERLADARSARFEFLGEPYMVYADIAGYEGLACWAVDMWVKSRLPSGAVGGYVPMTVIFLDGAPIALKDDARRMAKA